MHLNAGFTLSHVATFVAVAEAGSFRAGAERVNISQSAVSVRIQHLESRLGVPLFHRTTRSVQLTEQGQRLLAVARGILGDFERIALELRSEAALEKGHVTIGCVPSIAARVLPIAMARFQALYAGIELEVMDVDSGRIVSMLKNAEIDVGLVSEVNSEQIEFAPIFWDDFYLVVSKELSSEFKEPVSLSDAVKHPLVLSSSSTSIRRYIDQRLSALAFDFEVRHEALNTGTLIGLAAEGIGVAIVPGTSLASLRMDGCVSLRMVERFGRNIGVAVATHRSPSPALAAFRAFLENELSGIAGKIMQEFASDGGATGRDHKPLRKSARART